MTPTISIIVPVYNTQKYLSKCIDSILDQTFADFELLLINDGSKDNSRAICDKYAVIDNRIKVFHKDNGGVSSARNLGLREAQGVYICFIDSDDFVLPQYLQSLYDKRQFSPFPSLVVQACQGRKNLLLEEGVRHISKEDKAYYFMQNDLMTKSSEPSAKLFDRSIINEYKIEFPEGLQIGEDGVFLLSYVICIEDIIVSSDDNYFLRKREGSLSSKFHGFYTEKKCYELWKELLEKLLDQVNLPDSEKRKLLWEGLKKPFMRTIYSVYTNNLSSIINPKLFREVDPIGIELIKEFFIPNSSKQKILLFQIKHNLIRSMCLMGYVRNLFKTK